MRKTSKSIAPGARCASVEDWRHLQQKLLGTERQLDLRLQQEADLQERSRLREELDQLRAVLELCETLVERSDQEQREALPSANARVSDRLEALNLQVNSAKLQALRAAHTVFVVDDHAPTRYAAARLLKRAGYGVMEAATGEEALLRSDRASALLLDVNLPDVNGVEVCHRIKKYSRAKPVVLMSAVYTDELYRTAGMSAGADLYLTSLLDGPQLASTFDRLLAGQLT